MIPASRVGVLEQSLSVARARIMGSDCVLSASIAKSCSDATTPIHKSNVKGVVDSGNARVHIFNCLKYFPFGVSVRFISMTGVNGTEKVRVAVGIAVFFVRATDGTVKKMVRGKSIYKPDCPVNLLCMNALHYEVDSSDTGHTCDFKGEVFTLGDGGGSKSVKTIVLF